MKLIKNLLAGVWAAWGLVSFIITFLIFFLPSMVAHLFKDEKKGQYYFIKVSQLWMNVWLRLIGCPVKVYGRQHFKENENYVVVFNHNALLDVPLSAPYVPGPNKTIAKDSFARVPIFGWFYKRGSVLVNRTDEKSRVSSFEEMKIVLAKGMHMCIYPEGTRNRTTQPMKVFYEGAFKLAAASGKKIIPCVIKGTKEAMPIHKSFYLWPSRLTMEFLPPVHTLDRNVKEVKQEVYDKMVEVYISKNPGNTGSGSL